MANEELSPELKRANWLTVVQLLGEAEELVRLIGDKPHTQSTLLFLQEQARVQANLWRDVSAEKGARK